MRILQWIVFSGLILYFGKVFFIPLAYGWLVSIVLYPLCLTLEKRNWPKGLAIASGISILVIFFGLLLWLLVLQVQSFNKDLPLLLKKLQPAVLEFRIWLELNFNIPMAMQETWLGMNSKEFSTIFIKGTAYTTIEAIATLLLIPIYAALFLYYRRIFINFLELLVGNPYKRKLHKILDETVHTFYRYIKGMVFVYLIVAVLNSLGLLLLGVKHAILFGILTSIMTIIPYVGIMVSSLLPISMAWLTTDSIWYPIGVVAVFVFVQYLEANLIFPAVVGTQIKINTWAALVSIIAGGVLWGVSGMILFLPFVAILKIISGSIEDWKPIYILLDKP